MIESQSLTSEWEFNFCRVTPGKGFQVIAGRVTVTFSYRSIDDATDILLDRKSIYENSIKLWEGCILTPYTQESVENLFSPRSPNLRDLEIKSTQIIGIGSLPNNSHLASILAHRIQALVPPSVYQVDVTVWSSPETGATATVTKQSFVV